MTVRNGVVDLSFSFVLITLWKKHGAIKLNTLSVKEGTDNY